jgi:hypothetical protein
MLIWWAKIGLINHWTRVISNWLLHLNFIKIFFMQKMLLAIFGLLLTTTISAQITPSPIVKEG